MTMTATDTTTTTDLTDNPLMQREGLPKFDAILPEHVLPGVEASLMSWMRKSWRLRRMMMIF